MSRLSPARRRTGRAFAATSVAAVAALSLVACSSGGSGATAASAPSGSVSTASGTGPGTSANTGQGGGFGGGNAAQFAQIQTCLKAAGISLPTFSGRPSGTRPSGAPSNFPSGVRPSGMPSGIPSGARPGGGGAFSQILSSDAAKAALKACGITLPSGAPSGTASPSAS